MKLYTTKCQKCKQQVKNRLTMDNTVIESAVIEQRKIEKRKYTFFADAVKCFDKLWL